VHFHAVVTHVQGDIAGVQEVVGKILLDQIALVAAANNKLINVVMAVDL
jgi:hypothetical protein